jgi:hypothetical protein
MDDEHGRAHGIGQKRRQSRADDAQRGQRTPAHDQRRREGEMERLADGDGERWHHHVAGAARDIGQKIHQPDEDRTAEHHRAIEDRHLERPAGQTHGAVKDGTADQQQGRGQRRADQGDGDGDPGMRGCLRMIAGAERAADRRGHARAEARRRCRLQDQEQGEDHGDARQGIAAQPRHEQRIGGQKGDAGGGLADVGSGERQQQRQDGRFEDALGAVGQDGHDGTSGPMPSRGRLRVG